MALAGQTDEVAGEDPSRGHGAGMMPAAERLVRMPRGHPEALSDAWANLYLEFAVAVAARREGRSLPEDLVAFPTLQDGLEGMAFVNTVLRSSASDAKWLEFKLPC